MFKVVKEIVTRSGVKAVLLTTTQVSISKLYFDMDWAIYLFSRISSLAIMFVYKSNVKSHYWYFFCHVLFVFMKPNQSEGEFIIHYRACKCLGRLCKFKI